MRSSATTERGISSSRKPTTRIGNASNVNKRHRLHEIAGRHRAGRDPPAPDGEQHDDGEVRQRVERRLEERAQRTDADPRLAQLVGGPPSRSTSASWRPSVFTTIAPSKLSCVIADTSPTRSCTVCAGSSTRRV